MMRTCLAILTGLGVASTSIAAADDSAPSVLPAFEHVSCIGGNNEVKVAITGIEESVGLVTADLYRNDPDGFLKRAGRVAQVRFAAKAPITQFCMRAPKPGQYAIAVYHDENANKTLDKGTFGIPKEPWGISNDPVVRFAPPKIEETLFNVAKADGATVKITINN